MRLELGAFVARQLTRRVRRASRYLMSRRRMKMLAAT